LTSKLPSINFSISWILCLIILIRMVSQSSNWKHSA
jgi:hypothetical protein